MDVANTMEIQNRRPSFPQQSMCGRAPSLNLLEAEIADTEELLWEALPLVQQLTAYSSEGVWLEFSCG
tara:strand:+ start:4603 stop:4806 length:204 start_codon:yes stop_codon:yes gene_type:complete